MIAEALAEAGGVPLKVLADRMACLKGGVVANVVIPTPDYVRIAPPTSAPSWPPAPERRSRCRPALVIDRDGGWC